jgi:hypothetical protein
LSFASREGLSAPYRVDCAVIFSDVAAGPSFDGGGEDGGDHETVLRGRVCSSDTPLEKKVGSALRSDLPMRIGARHRFGQLPLLAKAAAERSA